MNFILILGKEFISLKFFKVSNLFFILIIKKQLIFTAKKNITVRFFIFGSIKTILIFKKLFALLWKISLFLSLWFDNRLNINLLSRKRIRGKFFINELNFLHNFFLLINWETVLEGVVQHWWVLIWYWSYLKINDYYKR